MKHWVFNLEQLNKRLEAANQLWMVNSAHYWVREGSIRLCQLFHPWKKQRRRPSMFHTTHHDLFPCRLASEHHALQTTHHLCWISRNGMKTTTSWPQLYKGGWSNNLPQLKQRGKRAAGHLFHGITFPQYWSCSTNKTSGAWGEGTAEELRRSKKKKGKGDAGRGEFWEASWVVQQQSAGHLHGGRKQNSKPPISFTTTPGTLKTGAKHKLAPGLEKATFIFFLAFEWKHSTCWL